jgi:hypothetical protein
MSIEALPNMNCLAPVERNCSSLEQMSRSSGAKRTFWNFRSINVWVLTGPKQTLGPYGTETQIQIQKLELIPEI